MFEVGKKYKDKSGSVNLVLAVGNITAFVRRIEGQYANMNGIEFIIAYRDFHLYEEYKEPRSIQPVYIAVTERNGTLFTGAQAFHSENDARGYYGGSSKIIDVIKVEYTEKV